MGRYVKSLFKGRRVVEVARDCVVNTEVPLNYYNRLQEMRLRYWRERALELEAEREREEKRGRKKEGASASATKVTS